MKTRILSMFLVVINALLLAKLWYSWGFSYFWLDDFNVLYWLQRVDGKSMLWFLINPASDFFRPVGTMVYWLLWHTFGLNPYPYHALAWTLHSLNALLLFLLLARITGSRFAAAVGALLFGLRANFSEIYWSFGFIFELLACLFMFLAFLFHCRERRSYANAVVVLLLAIFAIKAKEMAITLPALLFVYDLTQKRPFDRKSAFEFIGLAAIALWFTHMKAPAMISTSPDHPYYMDVTWLTLGRGYGWYFDRLYDIKLRWGAWISISVVTFLGMLYRRENRGTFFLAYIFISLLPAVFLVNHRGEFYWYIPFLGFAGLAAVLTDAVAGRVQLWAPTRATAIGLAAFVTIAFMHYSREARKLNEAISRQRAISEEYEGFVRQLSELPQPANGETVRYQSFPRYFSLETLTSITQVVFRRTDVKVEIVQAFPTSCHYCLEYEGRTLRFKGIP